jgi:AcrR family transcriptional regulator
VRAVDADEAAPPVLRRAPFSDNPRVGVRGRQTQQRILDAALRVFGEDGYHQCSIDRITRLSGCSRVAFYQYFESKEDVFRRLAGRVARELQDATDALDPLTPDAAGWAALRAWVERYAEVHERYAAVFRAFPAAAESDGAVTSGSARAGARTLARMRAGLVTTAFPPTMRDAVLTMLLECVSSTVQSGAALRAAASDAYPRGRVDDALTDVMHRALFGLQPDVNVHPPAGTREPTHDFTPTMREVLQREERPPERNAPGPATWETLVHSARDVFLTRGYYGARVDDLAAAAGVSHGTFYRYFPNKEALAQTVTVRAMRTASLALLEIPELANDDVATRDELRAWLRRYNTALANEAAMIRVWVDAAPHDETQVADSAAALDWGRRRLARLLRPRGFGDVDTEAVVMVAFLGTFGARRSPSTIEAAAHVIECGLLGR